MIRDDQDAGNPDAAGSTPAIFCVVSTSLSFVGTVGLLNSLRLTGHRQELVVLDAGLSARERELLRAHCTVVEVSGASASNPLLFKPFPATLEPEGVVVIVDSDVIVTASLDPVIAKAASGKICALPDSDPGRFFPEWESEFGLRAPLQRATYLNTAFVFLHASRCRALLDRWWSLSTSIEAESTSAFGADYATPLADGDQDAFNALAMSEVESQSIEVLPAETGPLSPWIYPRLDEVDIIDHDSLACRFRGTQTLMLHHAGRKPWMSPFVSANAYSRLLPRVLFESGVELRPEPSDVPFWLRPGRAAATTTRGLRIASPLVRLARSVAR